VKSKFCTLTAVSAALTLAFCVKAVAQEPAHAGTAAKVPPGEALARLKEGNERFVANKLQHPRQSGERRHELASGQHPFAVVLACADSRTPPEVVFDQGLGDVFVVRVAGNVLNDEVVGSIEYAVEHLGTQLIVVLGHEQCGAVAAARETIAAGTEAPGHVQSLVKALAPAVQATKGADAEATARANELNVAQQLRESKPVLREMAANGTVLVLGAHYKLESGTVEFLKPSQ